MEPQTIHSISNRETSICYVLEKQSSYYDFLFNLLREFNVRLPDLRGDSGKLPDIMEETDLLMYYENDDIDITEVIGSKKIFLIIKTNLKDKLIKFMEQNCIFHKP